MSVLILSWKQTGFRMRNGVLLSNTNSSSLPVRRARWAPRVQGFGLHLAPQERTLEPEPGSLWEVHAAFLPSWDRKRNLCSQMLSDLWNVNMVPPSRRHGGRRALKRKHAWGKATQHASYFPLLRSQTKRKWKYSQSVVSPIILVGYRNSASLLASLLETLNDQMNWVGQLNPRGSQPFPCGLFRGTGREEMVSRHWGVLILPLVNLCV